MSQKGFRNSREEQAFSPDTNKNHLLLPGFLVPKMMELTRILQIDFCSS